MDDLPHPTQAQVDDLVQMYHHYVLLHASPEECVEGQRKVRKARDGDKASMSAMASDITVRHARDLAARGRCL